MSPGSLGDGSHWVLQKVMVAYCQIYDCHGYLRTDYVETWNSSGPNAPHCKSKSNLVICIAPYYGMLRHSDMGRV